MQNVYSTPLRYKNFSGQQKSTTLHFHLTPREFMDWALDNMAEAQRLTEAFADLPDDIEKNPGLATQEQKIAMLQMIRTLAELGYGKPSEDSEVFDKSDKTFKYSAKYDAFRLFLFQNGKELTTFVSTLLSQEVMEEFAQAVSEAEAGNKSENEQPALNSANTEKKDPTQMSHEELVAAYKEKVQQ